MNAKYDLKIDEAIAEITIKIDNEICNAWKIKREDVIKSLQAQQRIDKAIEYIKEFRFATTDFSLHSDRLLSILQGEEVK